jgi:DNA-binding NtrC family response regulator
VRREWKGNVRELRSCVEQALLLAPGPEIRPADVFTYVAPNKGGALDDTTAFVAGDNGSSNFRDAKERMVRAFERNFLLQALRRNEGNITKAAEEVGMYRQNFQQKMRELDISVDEAVVESE